MGPTARDNMSFDEYFATVSVEEMHAKSREYGYLLEIKFGIVDSVVQEHTAQLFSTLAADNISYLREKFRAMCNRVSVIMEDYKNGALAEQHARDEASRLASMKWLHDYAIREAARTSAAAS